MPARNSNRKMFGSFVGVGTFIAFALSWFEHESLPWAVVHAVYSWFYIAYYALTKSGAMAPIDAPPTLAMGAIALAAFVGMIAIVSLLIRRTR